MAKPTKTQKKKLMMSIESKARKLFMCGIINSADVNAIERIMTKGFKKLS